jgi:hypothetical protein
MVFLSGYPLHSRKCVELLKEILNTLYVTKERAYLHLDHDTIRMEVKTEKPLQIVI